MLLVTGHGGQSQVVADAIAHGDPATGAAELDRYWLADLHEIDAIGRALRWRLDADDVLKDAWTRFATADRVATELKPAALAMARAVLVLATLAVLSGVLAAASAAYAPLREVPHLGDAAKALATIFPAGAGVALALVERRSRRGTWVEYRASAEFVLRHIYLHRARARLGGSPGLEHVTLSEAISAADARTRGRALLAATPENHHPEWPPSRLTTRIPPVDRLLGVMSAQDYDRARALNQLRYLEDAVRGLERWSVLSAVVLFGTAALATVLFTLSWRWSFLAACSAVAVSLVAALASWREYRQRDARADAMLDNGVAIRARATWLNAPGEERETPEVLESYVRHVETALDTEALDWERGLRQAASGFTDRFRRG